MTDTIKGYKAFDTADDGGLQCRDMRYEVGEEYAFDGKPEICECGYHFCRKLADCYNYYGRDARICEVEASGTITGDDSGKSVTDHIHIIRELSRTEILDAANAGNDCTGVCNFGDWNSGNRNSGDWNSGNWNSGNRNFGDCNSGNRNSGDRNSGNWNKTNLSSGVLCTQENECLIFDRPSGMTLRDWWNSDAAYLMGNIGINSNRWIYTDDMTDEEKAAHPDYETTGGYLHVGTGEPDFAGWWAKLTDAQKDIIKSIPNFDAGKWKYITSIDITEES